MALEQDLSAGQETVDQQLQSLPIGGSLMPEEPSHAAPGGDQRSSADRCCDDEETVPAPAQPGDAALTKILIVVQEIAVSSQRYHARAEQREGVIDHLRDEVERLRRGERRNLLRPLLADVCRLRNDLLLQADRLPDNYDAEQAARLLRSYAESVELTLESSGVVAFEPEDGSLFDPRMHRRVGAELTTEASLVGRIARVRRSGYLDIDANSPIAAAEVVLFAAGPSESGPARSSPAPSPDQ